jgi:hypothetical protein
MKSRNTTVDLEYYDLADGQRERRTFTTGDFTCDYLADWSDKKKFVGEINCDFIDDIYKFYYVFPLSSLFNDFSFNNKIKVSGHFISPQNSRESRFLSGNLIFTFKFSIYRFLTSDINVNDPLG